MTAETRARWEEFKARREYQRRRDAEIKEIIKDVAGAVGLILCGVASWFALMVFYA